MRWSYDHFSIVICGQHWKKNFFQNCKNIFFETEWCDWQPVICVVTTSIAFRDPLSFCAPWWSIQPSTLIPAAKGSLGRPNVVLLVPLTEHYLSSFKCGFLNIFPRQNLLRSLSCLLFLLRWKNLARKMSEKPRSIRLLRWFNFRQSGSRKNNRKAFEGASIEPTMFKIVDSQVKEELTKNPELFRFYQGASSFMIYLNALLSLHCCKLIWTEFWERLLVKYTAKIL